MQKTARQFFETKLKELATCQTILDTGGATPFQKDLAPYKEFFKNCDFKTLDINSAYNPDIVGDIHAIPLPEASVDGVLCKAVLEHVVDPIRACDEMHRILKPGGKIFIWVPFLYPFHCHQGFYKDYWRFTSEAVRYILRNFREVEIVQTKRYFETMIDLMPMPKVLRLIINPVVRLFDYLIPIKEQTSGFYAFAKK